MKKSLFFLFLGLTLLSTQLSAQTLGTIKGKLADTILHQSLKDASIKILRQKDSSLYKATLASDDGSFEIKNIPVGNYTVLISFQSYKPKRRRAVITADNKLVNLGTLYLSSTAEDLPDVVVTEASIVIKKDTVEVNAASFKTKPNAVAEDLLKKIPGVDVGTDGSIKAQGETVSRVLVNGKRFFGDDPKMATKNLPTDLIEKIQVFDDVSDQSKFTGFDDGNRVKTINITTKKNASKGYFGKFVAGDGMDENKNAKYDVNFNLHRFDGNSQLSFLGQGNNINKQNFSPQDILGGGPGGRMRGGFSASSSGSGSGITTTWAGGTNYRTSWGKYNSSIAASYFYNNLKVDVDNKSAVQDIISTDSSNFSNSTSSSVSKTPSHRININLEEYLDSVNSIVSRPNFSFEKSTPSSTSITTKTSDKGNLINSSNSQSNSNSHGFNINNANIDFRHKFNKKYRTISLELNFSGSENDGNGYNYSLNHFYQLGKDSILNQFYNTTSHSFTFNPTLSYTEPIGKNQILEFRYTYNYNKNYSAVNTYEFDSSALAYVKFDSLYSNTYKYNSNSHTGTVSYRLQKTKYNFNVGAGVQYADYTSNNLIKNNIISKSYVNFTPTANFIYNFKRTQNLRFFYSGRTGQPSVNNLQPIKTISGLDTTVGNPDLKPQFTHSIRLLYANFDPVSQRVFFATINASMTSNDIQSSVTNHKLGTKTTTYTNLNGTYNVNGYLNFGFPLKKPKSNLNLTTNIGYSQSQTLLGTDTTAAQSNFVHNTALGENIKWTTNLANTFDMNLSTGATYNIANNSLRPTLNANYFVYTAVADFTLYTKNGWILSSDFTYTYSGNRAAGYNASVPLITPSIAKQFLKGKAGELRFTIFDLLNQNTAVSRTVSGTSITDSKSNVLTRYYMLTFTFNLRNFAKQNQQRMPGFFRGMMPPGGGMMPPPGDMPRGGGGFGGGERPPGGF